MTWTGRTRRDPPPSASRPSPRCGPGLLGLEARAPFFAPGIPSTCTPTGKNQTPDRRAFLSQVNFLISDKSSSRAGWPLRASVHDSRRALSVAVICAAIGPRRRHLRTPAKEGFEWSASGNAKAPRQDERSGKSNNGKARFCKSTWTPRTKPSFGRGAS